MVATPLVKCFIWFEIALVCKWLSQLQVAARPLNAGYSERQSHNGTFISSQPEHFLTFPKERQSVGYGDMQKNLIINEKTVMDNGKTSIFSLTDCNRCLLT